MPGIRKCAVCGLYKSENISMHKMPTNKETRKLWSEAIGKKIPSSSVICSNHFKQSDFQTNLLRKILKPSAVPSQFHSNSITQSQAMSQTVKNLDSDLSNEQIKNNNSENHLNDQNAEDNNSQEEEQCYIYYLDEEQKVGIFESSVSHYFVKNVDSNSNESNEIISPSSSEINHQNTSSNVDIDITQLINDSCTEAKRLEVSKSPCMTVLQNLSLEPFIGLNSSHFITKHAWQTFCDIISEYRGQIYDLQDHNNILQTKINRLKELLNIHINKI